MAEYGQDNTMIRIKKELRELLRKRKKYRRETYSDIIEREMKGGGIK
jgi:hypothetical protein